MAARSLLARLLCLLLLKFFFARQIEHIFLLHVGVSSCKHLLKQQQEPMFAGEANGARGRTTSSTTKTKTRRTATTTTMESVDGVVGLGAAR